MKKYVKRTIIVAVILVIVGAIINAIGGSANADNSSVNEAKGQPVVLTIDGPNADHRKCVTNGEWGRIANPARTKHDLNILLDGPGTDNKGNVAGVWYPICGMSDKKGRVLISYRPNSSGKLILRLALHMIFEGQGSGFYKKTA